jgi:hypothetical protein
VRDRFLCFVRVCCIAFSICGFALSETITQTLPGGEWPYGVQPIGDFRFLIPDGHRVLSAQVSGLFLQPPPIDIYADSIEVASGISSLRYVGLNGPLFGSTHLAWARFRRCWTATFALRSFQLPSPFGTLGRYV